MENCAAGQKAPGELADLQWQPPQNTRTGHNVQKVEQVWHEASVDEHGAPVWAQTQEVHSRWKQGQTAWEEWADTVQVCRNTVGKANMQVQFKVAREEKGNKEGFFKCTSSRKKTNENVEQWEWALLSGAGNPMTRDMEKTQVLDVFFPQFSLASLPPGSSPSLLALCRHEEVPTAGEDGIREY